jgi:hypothetical protein
LPGDGERIRADSRFVVARGTGSGQSGTGVRGQRAPVEFDAHRVSIPMIGKLLRFAVLLLFMPLIYAFSYEAVLFLGKTNLEDLLDFLFGIVAYLLLYVLFLNGRIGFLETLEHELSHAAASLTILHMPGKLVVDPQSGGKAAGVVETVGCFWVALAPYFLPLFTLPLLLLRPIMPPPFDRVIDFLLGSTLAFHYVRLIKDLRVKQTDITSTGCFFSFVFAIFMNLIFLLLILTVVTGGYSRLPEYVQASWNRTKAAYAAAYQAITTLQIPDLKGLFARGT